MVRQEKQPSGYGYDYTFVYFGMVRHSRFGSSERDDPEYRFTSSTERSELLLLAVEALLVYALPFSGLDLPGGGKFVRVRAEIDGVEKTYQVSDFGYPSTPDELLAP